MNMSITEILQSIIIGIGILIATNLTTWHIGRFKNNKTIKQQIGTLILEVNIITEAIMNSNGFGERFANEMKHVRARRSLELKEKG